MKSRTYKGIIIRHVQANCTGGGKTTAWAIKATYFRTLQEAKDYIDGQAKEIQ